MGGANPSVVNVIDYITIATTGNATDFGDLSEAKYGMGTATNSTIALSGGGYTTVMTNVIEYVTIASTGNGVDFGDLTLARRQVTGCSNGHGGL